MKQLDFSKGSIDLKGLKEMFVQDMAQGTRQFLKELMNEWMEYERDEFMEQALGQESSTSPGADYRNGYYDRTLRSPLGLIEDLRVPRTRSGIFYPEILEKGKHISTRTQEGLARMYLRGVSTHHVGEVLEGMLGYRVSSGYVSLITKALDRDVASFYKRKLADDVKVLFLDGIYLRVKGLLKSRKKPILVAYGIHQDGSREFIHFRLSKSESETEWVKFTNELYQKGLTGDLLELICTDGCPGLLRALETVYPYVKHQRCWAHKMRNVASTCKKSQMDECVQDAQRIYYGSSKREAVLRFRAFKAKWGKDNPKAVHCIEKDLEELLTFYDFDPILWKKIRTTNVIERAFGEVRRRTKVMGSFPNDGSCQRMVYALFAYFNSKWARKSSFIKVAKELVA
jgi:transposase-like protein